MEHRTTFRIPQSPERITYNDPVMFIGSCFATSIGEKFRLGKMPVLINPAGTVYNPVSVINTLDTIVERKEINRESLYNNNGKWISFNHYTDFSSDNPEELAERINRNSEKAYEFLGRARFLFITFGTARVYRFLSTGTIVSNCHKLPGAMFSHGLLDVETIVKLWRDNLDRLKSLFPSLKVIFTVSPVRHWKDGAHGNQVSKSVLFLAIEKLMEHTIAPSYFPAYELVMDDLRDYRYYTEDMLHISPQAVDYIWESFRSCYFDRQTSEVWQEVTKLLKAVGHRIQTGSADQIREFASSILLRIDELCSKYPYLDLESEREYFTGLTGKNQ